MIASFMTVAGAAGAALFFHRNAWPSAGIRLRNLAASIWAVLLAAALWAAMAEGWRFGAGWMAAMLLLQWSHVVFRPGSLVALRALTAVASVAAGVLLLDL